MGWTGDQGVNDAALEFVPALLRVVATIGRQTIRPSTRSSGLTFDRRDGIDQWDRLRHVVPIAPLVLITSGMPCRSVSRCCLEPRIRLSVGFGSFFLDAARSFHDRSLDHNPREIQQSRIV